MTKEKLIQENQELKKRIDELEKEVNNNYLLNDNNKLYEIRNLLERQLNFYETIIMNLTRKEDENNEY